jgi:hypothetical protein
MAIRNILQSQFGIFHGHMYGKLLVIWYIVSRKIWQLRKIFSVQRIADGCYKHGFHFETVVRQNILICRFSSRILSDSGSEIMIQLKCRNK